LTEGKPSVVGIVSKAPFPEPELLRLAAAVERVSEHPLASAIVRAATERSLDLPDVSKFDTVSGKGVAGIVADHAVLLGSQAFLRERGVDAATIAPQAEAFRHDGATALFVAVDGKVAGILAIADPIKASTLAALKALRDDGVAIVMVTGDNKATADAVGRRLGIAQVQAEVLPENKAAVVDALKRAGRVVAMAGDGINDAPALAAADIGIAMGSGTDVAIESAGVTLLRGDLMGIVRARRLSRATMRNIRQNLFFAFIYNAAGIPVAAGVLYPVFGILLSPIIAAAAMALSSVSVIANALRLRLARV
jgi:Cu+-exporting ATPase